ncbi:uncharacterized protein MONOS_15610 [Monocercomonoides exilis]|uniref:uncharacterized protein n=1 Tax=Monocercomonoides exilis TaxID=2049356 RepID=UPI00355A70AF|nr:hypothetical protein MONOS_15610 [Monocercomonoides exilis]|eukprot:MONOS_15610.1-p1 / transcript=MONOS_15610.1 / gene=MONOS_15610 / organism=Monocercomonoides_exilis_PA203 / gene_product=unspecified product / transcript_product=unspecified product / location=Mono_scaffold01287:4701-5903(-) / protein_length=401 / sequence_SO=supercontig / SO=protein_coding / is_pseudo=false
MEGVRRLEKLFEEMMEAKEMHLPVVREQIMHNQMCIDVTLEDVEEMLGNAEQRGRRAAAPDTSGACTCGWRAVEGVRGGGTSGRAAAGIAEEQGGRPGEDEGECWQTLSKTDGKCEGHVVELEVEKEGLGRQIRELKEQHEEAKQEMEKRYSEFNMLLQKIQDDERISKRTRGLAEQLQEKVKIIRMRERKILELSEKNNAEVKELQEQLVAMKEKAELIYVGIEKEKKLHSQQGRVASECSEGAVSGAGVSLATPSSLSSTGGGEVQSLALLILKLGLCQKCQEKFAASIRDGSAVVLGPDTSGKGVVVKAGSGVSVVGEANSSGGEGGGGGSEGTRSLISERSEKNSAGANGGDGGGGGGRADTSEEEDDEQDGEENIDADCAVKSAGADDKRAEGAV